MNFIYLYFIFYFISWELMISFKFIILLKILKIKTFLYLFEIYLNMNYC